MRTNLVLDALRMALGTRGPGADVQLIHHSDRGSQYTSIDYTQTLQDHGVLASVGSVGDAYDCERRELRRQLQDRAGLRPSLGQPDPLGLALVEHIGWSNHDRLHESLGDIPPVEFEQLHATDGSISPEESFGDPSRRAAERLRRARSEPGEPGECPNGAKSGPPAQELPAQPTTIR